jgi:hypothetical protein
MLAVDHNRVVVVDGHIQAAAGHSRVVADGDLGSLGAVAPEGTESGCDLGRNPDHNAAEAGHCSLVAADTNHEVGAGMRPGRVLVDVQFCDAPKV